MLKKEEVKHIASLARLGMKDAEAESFSKELSAILDWVKKLEEVKTENISPDYNLARKENALRQDEPSEFSGKEKITGLFPEEHKGYDKVKSVLG